MLLGKGAKTGEEALSVALNLKERMLKTYPNLIEDDIDYIIKA